MIYFVSDIHLGAGDSHQARRTESAFCRWLDSVAADAEAIYLLGDIFDFWFEYRRVVPQGFTRVLGRLADLSLRGVKVVLFTGNHDMWCYDYLTRECGIEIIRKPQVITIRGQKIHLAHGDNMNIKGQPMLRLMNAFFRSKIARLLFSWLIHPDLALKFGGWWSGKSRKSHGGDVITPRHLGFLVEYARKHHAENSDTTAYIFGHMHYPYEVQEDNLRVLFLSNWSHTEAVYAAMDTDNILQLNTFTIDETVS
ncbi:MAG: UDP-2,3-diacylglucosamine diphosphatase [Alistipes sp.]|nr:UDP-2,3-diacylglucosamine diphosphatase [Alistipes sp.]